MRRAGFGWTSRMIDAPMSIRTTISNYYRNNASRSNQKTMLGALGEGNIQVEYVHTMKHIFERAYNGSTFIEKTPGPSAVVAMKFILELWPNARMIFAKRRVIESIMSAQRKFPHASFEWCCENWAQSMSAWRRVRLTAANQTEVEQLTMARYPLEAARDLGRFLELDDDMISRLGKSFGKRPQSTQGGGDALDVLSLEDSGWSEEQKALFVTICGEEMRAFGYTYDRQYSSKPSSEDAAREVI